MSLRVVVVVEGVGRAYEDSSFVQLDVYIIGDVQATGKVSAYFEDECAATVVGDVVEGTLDGGGIEGYAIAFATEEGGFVKRIPLAVWGSVVLGGDEVGGGCGGVNAREVVVGAFLLASGDG